MKLNENVNFSAQVIVKDDKGLDTVVMYLSATLDASKMNVSINCNTANVDLAVMNAEEVKKQYTEFETTVRDRAKELGYIIY